MDRAVDLIEERGSPAQLCVYARGEVAIEHAFGCQPDSLFFLFSASKPLVALLVHRLAERDELSLDDAVAAPGRNSASGASSTSRSGRSCSTAAACRSRTALCSTHWP
jgi:CubicO group peptidase (beta-lactamase class C family)